MSITGLVSINEKDDEEEIFETTSQVEEGVDTRIINTDQYTERANHLEGKFENLPFVLTGGRTIDLEDVVELWRIGTTTV